MYAYNRLLGATDDASTWTFRRGWTPGASANRGVHALLDIYQLIGRDAMARAYRVILPMRPLYGQPLAAAALQAFIDNAPPAARAQVAASAAMIG